MAAAVVLLQQQRQRVDYTHSQLPSFDSYVYVAMAENPSVFTVAPWGYRLLHPTLVSALPPRFMVRAFRGLGLLSLALSGGALFLFLRRLGHGEMPSLLAVLAFALSGPVAEALRVPFIGEPLALLAQIAFLAALESGAGLMVLALLLVLAVLAKEHALLLLPLVFLVRRAREGNAAAVRAALLCGLPAFVLMATLRLFWTPYLHTPRAPFDLHLMRAGMEVLRQTWRPTAEALLLGGITPLAVLGALRTKARPFLARYGYLALAMPALSLVAWINVPSRVPVPLFGTNTLRLLIYALPFLLPLALMAVDRVWPHLGTSAAPSPPRRVPSLLAGLAVLVLVVTPLAVLDRYRRVPLHEQRDGPLVRATCQESLRVARRLDRGEAVSFDPQGREFVWGASDPGQASRMRWFLREGWGAQAHYGTGPVLMHQPAATLVVPSLARRDLQAVLSLEASTPRRLQAFVNGQPAGALTAAPAMVESVVSIPSRLLFRGDNLLTLLASDDWRGVRLRQITLRPVP